jgi:nucleoside-diphosphate-sugar epimerase
MLELTHLKRSAGLAERDGPRPGLTRALVTGGNGFIGQYLVSALLGRGHFVRVLDLAPPANPWAEAEYMAGSILEPAVVMRALEGIDCVYHLAGIPHLWTARVADFDLVNRQGTEMMLSAAIAQRVPRFVHCSSEATLFGPRAGPDMVDETVSYSSSDLAGPYSRSKLGAEQAAFTAAQQGLGVVVVNPTIPVGPGDRNCTPPTAMLMHFMAGGSFFLNCTLNLVDVRDVANGMILAAERGRVGERYILGGEHVSLAQLLNTVTRGAASRRSINVPGPLALLAAMVSEWLATHVTHRMPVATTEGVRLALRAVQLDSSKAARELGYRPREIEDALSETTAWLHGVRGAPSLSPQTVA